MDRLTSIQIYCKAVEAGSFAGAADALGLSAQLVGKHVRALEDHLGVRLINRTTRRQSLTEMGRVFYERGRVILAEMDAARDLVNDSRAQPRGRLRVNASVTFGVHALAPELPRYLNAHPEVSIELTLTDRVVDLIDEGFDVVFRIGSLADSGLIARSLNPYELILCAAPSYIAANGSPSTPDDLRQHQCLGFAYGMGDAWTFEGPKGSVTVDVSGRFKVNNGQALVASAVAGLGIVLQSRLLLRKAIAEGALVPLLESYMPPMQPMHLLYPPDRRMTPKLRSFIVFAVQTFGRNSAGKRYAP